MNLNFIKDNQIKKSLYNTIKSKDFILSKIIVKELINAYPQDNRYNKLLITIRKLENDTKKQYN